MESEKWRVCFQISGEKLSHDPLASVAYFVQIMVPVVGVLVLEVAPARPHLMLSTRVVGLTQGRLHELVNPLEKWRARSK